MIHAYADKDVNEITKKKKIEKLFKRPEGKDQERNRLGKRQIRREERKNKLCLCHRHMCREERES